MLTLWAKAEGQDDVNTLLYRRIHLVLRRGASCCEAGSVRFSGRLTARPAKRPSGRGRPQTPA